MLFVTFWTFTYLVHSLTWFKTGIQTTIHLRGSIQVSEWCLYWPSPKVLTTGKSSDYAGSYRWQLYASHNDIVENIDYRRKSALKFLLQDIVLLDALVYLRVCESQTRYVKLKTRVRKSQAITESGCGSLKMSWLLDAEISKCNDFWVCKSQM